MLRIGIFEDKIRVFIDICVKKSTNDIDTLGILENSHIETEKMVEALASLCEIQMFSSAQPDRGRRERNARGLEKYDDNVHSHGSSRAATPVRGVEDFKFQESFYKLFNEHRKTFFDTEREVLKSACLKAIDSVVYLDEQQQKDLDDKSIFGRRKKGAKGSLGLKRWVLNALKPELSRLVLQNTTSAVDRAARLSEDVPKACDRFSKDAWDMLVSRYLNRVLSLAEQVLPDDDPKDEPDTFFFKVVSAVNSIAHEMNTHYRNHVSPHLQSDLNMKSRGRSYNRESLRTVEMKLLNGLLVCLRSNLRYAERLLSKQRPGDFKPRDETECFDSTEACYSVCQFVSTQTSAVLDSLSGGNLDNYLTVFGSNLHSLILAHMKKFTVSPMGAMVVSQDVKRYNDTIREFHIESVDALFNTLRDMSSLLMLPVGQIGVLVQQRLMSVPAEDIHAFVKIRSDYAKEKFTIMSALNL